MKSTLSKFPIYLYLLPLFFAWHGFIDYSDIMPPKDALVLVLFYTGVAGLLTLLAWLFFRNFRKASLFAFCLLGLQFFFGSVHDFLKKTFPGSFIIQYSFILPVIFLFFLGIAIYLKKSKRSLRRTTYYLNSLLMILLLIDTGLFLFKSGKVVEHLLVKREALVRCDSCRKPDIYIIIADGYPGRAALMDLYHYDNSPFENALEKRGFHIVDSSISNYNFTAFSLASMLNMNYMEGIKGNNNNKTDLALCVQTLRENNFLHFLQNEGYRFYNYSIFDFYKNPSVTQPTFLPLRTKPLTSQTFTYRILRDLGYHLATTFHMPSVIRKYKLAGRWNNEKLYALTEKTATNQTKRPKFVFTHLIMPHHPLYYDSNGVATPITMLEDGHYYNKGNRISYLKYSNKKFLALIAHILASSSTLPIILLMGDHGFREFDEAIDPKYFYMTLNAIFIPGGHYEGFYPGQSNINQLRILLNSEFGQHLPLLKDSTILITE